MSTYIPNKAVSTDNPVERLSGSVERVTFHSEESSVVVQQRQKVQEQEHQQSYALHLTLMPSC
jgi:hypothetical protein